VVREFLEPSEVQALVNRVDRYCDQILPTLPDGEAYFQDKEDPGSVFRMERIDEHDSYFSEFRERVGLIPLAEALIGDEVRFQSMVIFGKAPRIGKPAPPHQDGNYFRLRRHMGLTMWIAVDKSDKGNGCLRYLQGSHKEGMIDHELSGTFGFSLGVPEDHDLDRSREVVVEMEPGDMAIHSPLMVHMTDGNPSDRKRRALGVVYFGASDDIDHEARDSHQKKTQAEWKEKGAL